jgi:hypothetical protein
MSVTSPPSTPACTAAPIATTSSGFTDWFGAFPNKFLIRLCTPGILVDPPTSTFSSIESEVSSASFSDLSIGVLQR